jgi:hypothetical protein
LVKAAREIGRGAEPARKSDLGKGCFSPPGSADPGHQGERPLQSYPLYKSIQRFTRQRSEDSMKMERREACGLGDYFKFKRLIDILQDEIDGSIDALDVIERLGLGFFRLFSQDL